MIAVPNLKGLMKKVAANNLEFDDVLYRLTDDTPITVNDVIFGWGKEIIRSGYDYYGHKCGFSIPLMAKLLTNAGFEKQIYRESELDIKVIAGKKDLSSYSNFI
jgi:hypothetical protein